MTRILFLMLVLTACSETPTSVRVIVEAEPGVRAATARTHVVIRGAAAGVAFGVPSLDETTSLSPFELALSPLAEDATRVFEVTVTAEDVSGEYVARARTLGSYIDGTERIVRLVLEDSCRGVVCGEGETCTSSSCVDAHENPQTSDAGPPDAGCGFFRPGRWRKEYTFVSGSAGCGTSSLPVEVVASTLAELHQCDSACTCEPPAATVCATAFDATCGALMGREEFELQANGTVIGTQTQTLSTGGTCVYSMAAQWIE